MSAINSTLRKITREIQANGYTVKVLPGRQHARIYDKNGKVIADPSNNQIISIPASPSDNRWIKNLTASLRRAGVLQK